MSSKEQKRAKVIARLTRAKERQELLVKFEAVKDLLTEEERAEFQRHCHPFCQCAKAIHEKVRLLAYFRKEYESFSLSVSVAKALLSGGLEGPSCCQQSQREALEGNIEYWQSWVVHAEEQLKKVQAGEPYSLIPKREKDRS